MPSRRTRARKWTRGMGPRRAEDGYVARLRYRRGGLCRPRLHRQERRRDSRCVVGTHRQEATTASRITVGTDVMRRVERYVMLADRRPPVERSPLQPRPPQGRHRAARIRSERSARRIQEGKLRALPGHEAPRRRGHGEQAVDRPLLRGARKTLRPAETRADTDDVERAER